MLTDATPKPLLLVLPASPKSVPATNQTTSATHSTTTAVQNPRRVFHDRAPPARSTVASHSTPSTGAVATISFVAIPSASATSASAFQPRSRSLVAARTSA